MKYDEDTIDLVIQFLEEQQDIMTDNHAWDCCKTQDEMEGDEWAMETAIEMIKSLKGEK